MRLTIVSHACITIEAEFGKLLCDPWFLNEPVYNFSTWKYPLATIPPERLVDGLTHLFISHSHEDHFHIPSIDLIPRDVTVLLPDYAWYRGPRARTVERVMRALGFRHIVPMTAFEDIVLEPDLRLTPIPAAASKTHDWENCGLVIEHDGCRVLNMNDCPSDDALYDRVVERFPHFDLMLVQYAGVTIHPGRFRMTEPEMRRAVAEKRANFDEQQRAMERLSIGTLVPFAGDFGWYSDSHIHCNWACRATPALFQEWMSRTFPETGTTLELMYPGDAWTPAGGVERNHPPIDWSGFPASAEPARRAMKPKVDRIEAWLARSRRDDLAARSKAFLDLIEREVAEIPVDFEASVRVVIEDSADGLGFVWRFAPDTGFRVLWSDTAATDQTFYLREALWASVLEGKVMLGMLSWIGEIDQHVAFRIDLAKMWFWTETHLDLNNRNPQVLVDERLLPEIRDRIRPRLGVFEPERELAGPVGD